jgi:cell wall-associated NlpC family hydrolase
MKNTLLATLIFLSSVSFFSGCTTTTPNANKKLKKESSASVYNIMGIKAPTKKEPVFVVRNDNTPEYHFITNSYIPESHPNMAPVVSDEIEVISYAPPSYQQPPMRRVQNIRRYSNRQQLIRNIESEAKSFLGTRYVWGATGPNKFDCSGFTQWVFRDAGINIPRVSRDQAKVGQYVSFENLRKGDMVFFDTKKHKQGIVTHVGIYLGNGNFIHASSAAKKVVVFNFNEKPYYKKRFLWGRRVVRDNIRYASN